MRNWNLQYLNPLKEKFGDPFFQEIPTQAGVYFFLDQNNSPLYIGKADNLKKRLQSYRRARPGQVADHTLEMIEMAYEIKWELHPSGKEALSREKELLQAIRPPFNIAGTQSAPYLFLGVQAPKRSSDHSLIPIQLRLTHHQIEPGFRWYGCFKQRGKIKAGYAALLRLFYASACDRDRFHFPAKISQAAPPYQYKCKIHGGWQKPLHAFLSGKDMDLIKLIFERLLSKENIPRFMYAPIQTDIDVVREFFRVGPESTRRLANKLGFKRVFISQSTMEKHFAQSVLPIRI